jgi:uncharacterized repeat protein (TIGR01451 family)
MKFISNYFKIFLLGISILFCSTSNAQVNAFTFTTDQLAIHDIGTSFVVTAAINSGNMQSTPTNATLVILYNSTLVAFDPGLTFLHPCMSYGPITNSSVTININNLASCTQNVEGAIGIGVAFKFLCPDSCANGTIKNAVFNATITTNFNTSFTGSCTAKGKLSNNVLLKHSVISYNSINSEVIYELRYRNPNCYKIKDPIFNITLSDADAYIVPQPYGYDHNYTVTPSGNSFNISPNIPSLEQDMVNDIYFRYKVKLLCTTLSGYTLNSNARLKGENCFIANSTIRSHDTAYTIPSNVNNNPHLAVLLHGFFCSLTNDGNMPLTVQVTSVLPPIHLTGVQQHASYTTAVGSITYYDCFNDAHPALPPAPGYPLIGGGFVDAANNTVPINTKKFLYTITNLPPGEQVFLYTYYDETSSCNGAAASPPFTNNLQIVYNCAIQQNPCNTCGPGNYIIDTFSVITRNPNIYCDKSTDILTPKAIGDTINLCYSFYNSGDAALNNGIYTVPLPNGIRALPQTATYSGFSSSPTTSMSGDSIKFNLPQLPVGNTIYQICFRAVIEAGATAGAHVVNNIITGTNPNYINTNTCRSTININAVSAISIEKKLKGSLDAGYSTNGQGEFSSFVDYQIKLYNSGTTPIDHLVVIDRIPTIGNLTILGNPLSVPILNGFNMFLQTVPPSTDYNTQYTTTQNICTNWTSAGTNCNAAGTWIGTLPPIARGVKFTFDPTFKILPGDSYTINFRTKLPKDKNVTNFTDCNTAGFFAIPIDAAAPSLLPAESPVACITIVRPCDTSATADFQLAVQPEVNNYIITSVVFNEYPNSSHQWYVLSSPNPNSGPYTPVFSSTSETLTFAPAQYNVYYTVIHKLKTECVEKCSSVIQYQSKNRADDCCLATQYWPNGAGTDPQEFSAAFETDMTNIGGGQYTINTYPTYNYSSSVTHQWYVLSSPNHSGGPYTPITQSTGAVFTYAPANDGLYYFVIHKVKSACGEACYGQSLCRNCDNKTKCELCGVVDCSLLDSLLPTCHPPINLVNNCRRGILSWSSVPAAGGYQVEMSLNDPECCKTKYEQIGFAYGVNTNSIQLNTLELPKYDCIRWRVRSKCDNGYSDWSDWTCYYCESFEPLPLLSKNGSNTNTIKEVNVSPQVIPNPNNGEMNLTMRTDGELVISIDVFNPQGILVKSIPQNKYPDGKFVTRLNMGANTAKGLYLVVFKTNVGTFNKKVIIN